MKIKVFTSIASVLLPLSGSACRGDVGRYKSLYFVRHDDAPRPLALGADRPVRFAFAAAHPAGHDVGRDGSLVRGLRLLGRRAALLLEFVE